MQFVHTLLISNYINVIQSGHHLLLAKVYRESDICLCKP